LLYRAGRTGASFRYNRRTALDIPAIGLFSHRRQERYPPSNRLARPVNNLKPSSTDDCETPRLYRAFLLASTYARRLQCRCFLPSLTARHAFSYSLNEDDRSMVADRLPATSMHAQCIRSVHALTFWATPARRHTMCVPHPIAQDIEPEVSPPVSTPRPGTALRPARLF
jgi:hypothetical protein